MIRKSNCALFEYIMTYQSSPKTLHPSSEKFFNYISSRNELSICPICTNHPRRFKSYAEGYAPFCGQICGGKGSSDQRMNTMVQKYGVTHIAKLPEVMEKRKQTNIAKYGHTCFLQSTEGIAKTTQFMMDKYGVNHYSKTEEFSKKFTNTMNERYGVEYAMQSPELMERYRASMQKHHGVVHPSQSPTIYQNRNTAMLQKYGARHAMQVDVLKRKHDDVLMGNYGVTVPLKNTEIHQRMKNTMVKLYGGEYSAQVGAIFEKMLATNLERYGVEYPLQNEEVKTKKRLNMEYQGNWIPRELLADCQLYYRHVARITNRQPLDTLNNFNNRGMAGVDGAYHVDHKVSIKYGFENSIPPYIIGHICNLEMLPWRDNIYKSASCSINPEDLFNNITNHT